LSLVKAGYSGVLPSLLAELFPTETRGIGMSLSYSISVTIFGGFAPLIATWLIAETGDPLSPSFYLMFTAVLSMLALSFTAGRLHHADDGRRQGRGAQAARCSGAAPSSPR
jgi:MHS family proline/betaine transporter-like MFS transporter